MKQVESLIEDARALSRKGQHEAALSCIRTAVALAPRDCMALNTRGMILDSLGRQSEALADYEHVLSIQPDFADAINNRGILYAHEGRFEQALACYERSLEIEPEQLQARYNRATALLSLGRWLRGFREFEIRWRLFPQEAGRLLRLQPVWLGQRDVSGKTVLLHHEQGYGDALQFSRYAALVTQLGAQVIVAVPAALATLMETLPGRPQIVCERSQIPAHDYCCSLMSLPYVFSTTPQNVPADIPYLRADPGASRVWAQRMGSASRPRIGLVWSGRRYPPINYPRDMSLQLLRPLLNVNADFVCLQTDLTDEERAELAVARRVVRYGDSFEDFADTAALIDNLDLVITVDTAVAHLAGALGKPVWVMNRFASCWRWMQGRADSPWYPSLRLFRQPSPGDWIAVVRDVCKALGEFVSRRGLQPAPATSIVSLLNAALTDHQQQRLPEAIKCYRRVLALEAARPEALHYLGVALAQQKKYEEALQPLSRVLSLQPENAAVFNHHGNALAGLDRHEEALVSYERAIGLDPSFAEAHYNKGMALAALGKLEAALEAYQQAIALKPDHAASLNNLGNALSDLNRIPEALDAYDQATQVSPVLVDAWVNRANALRRLARYEEAVAAARVALDQDPEHARAHSALGAAAACAGRFDEALASYRRALQIEPGLAEAVWNTAIADLSLGRLREGWLGYEARWQVKSLQLSVHHSPDPPWLGKDSLEGKVILLHAEQGYGDSIQFCRYAPLVAARGARVLLGMPGGLATLMRSLPGVDSVVVQPPLPAFDLHCPLLSLPLAFGTELTTIPASVPYLYADPVAQADWAARLGPRTAPRVGFAWSGSAKHTNDMNRSIALKSLLPLMSCDVFCVSLQKEIRASDAPLLSTLPSLYRLGETLTDFASTAALLCELDLVITVDTAIAHLAGALGRPVWILLPHVADWRWLQQREDSPWYPTARLFRQLAPGDWDSVIERVAAELREWSRDGVCPVRSGFAVLDQIVGVGRAPAGVAELSGGGVHH
jgi:tetratricopeptide (TPR) repeat protein